MKSYYILDKHTLTFFTLVIATLAVTVLALIKMSRDSHPDAVKWLANHPELVTVSRSGMSFENEAGFVTLERQTGDDRSFLLRPSPCR